MRIIVTGAASGIGRAVAGLFAAQPHDGLPAQMMLVDRDGRALEAAATVLRDSGAEVATCVADLADAEAPRAAVAAAAAAFGGLDTLVSNAGMIHAMPLLSLSADAFDEIMRVNARATLLLAQAAHPHLKASRGSVVATASIAAENPIAPLGAYAASKVALVMLMRQLAAEWGPDGIRCNCVSPGPTHTGMTDAVYSDQEARERRGHDMPLGRVGEPLDIARAIHFLAGPAAGFVTGVNLLVDGGLTAAIGNSRASAANRL